MQYKDACSRPDVVMRRKINIYLWRDTEDVGGSTVAGWVASWSKMEISKDFTMHAFVNIIRKTAQRT